MSKLCVVVATLFTAKAFLLDHIARLCHAYDVTVAANADGEVLCGVGGANLVRVPIERKISLLSDLHALVSLFRIFRRERFDAVHSYTPKAGLIAMLAAFAARVPVRVHTFTGQVWATRRGFSRLVLKSTDRCLAMAATHILVDSPSQLAFLRQEGVLPEGRGEVLGKGSVSGVNPARFRADPRLREVVRSELEIPASALVFVYVGRLSRDKGVLELARAFASVGAAESSAYLLLVGPDEESLESRIEHAAGHARSRVRTIGMTDAPERYMAAGDVLCLPSHREGFGAVIIEAAAAGLPAIGSRIYGVTDAIEEGKTGLLVPPGDVESLAGAMLALARDDGKRHALARAARARALRDFPSEAVTSALLAFYERVLPPGEPASSAVRPGL